jgi:hypothetical protein
VGTIAEDAAAATGRIAESMRDERRFAPRTALRTNGHGDPRPDPITDDTPIVRQLDYVAADIIEDDSAAIFDDELVEGVIGRGKLAVIYGESNSGKTFLALDLGASITREVRWLGHNCIGGLVVYLASEAPGSVEMRLRTYQRHHGIKLPRLIVVQSPINLYDGQADALAVVALITKLEQQYGEACVLVVGDTLARLSAGANENSGEDMGVVLAHIQAIQKTGAAFLLIHHTGKDTARGMRGWSGLRAAVDTEIEVSGADDAGVHVAVVTKQRDLPGKGHRVGFRLEPVALGRNRWGSVRGSCVVIDADAPPKVDKPAQARRQSELAGAITEVLSAHGTGMKKSALVKHFNGRFDSSKVYERIKKMAKTGRLHDVAGMVSLCA